MRGDRRWASAVGLVVGLLAVVLGACGGDDTDTGTGGDAAGEARPAGAMPDWPAPDDPVERTTAADRVMESKEHLQTHRHAHLDVFVDGKAVKVPAGIGIDTTDPGVKRFDEDDAFGGIEECDQPCISPLHT